ncbi:MAG: peptidylprolyl isomerase [Burkholderiales bacterium]|nr:peptidylprolyl isomerase [Burkholderiales bacterium]
MKLLLTALFLSVVASLAHAGHPMVEMQTNQGNIVVELYPDKAPKTVENFLHYVKNGFYEGTVFHRVVKNFMVQGGAFDKAMNWRKGEDPIQCEAKNGLTNEVGTIAMARARDPNSATSQFFFNLESNKHLNHHRDHPDYYGHAVFGRIVKGMDVVQKIADIQTSAGGPFASDVPVEPIVIEKVAILPEEIESPPTQVKSKGKTNGKTKNQPRRHLAGT